MAMNNGKRVTHGVTIFVFSSAFTTIHGIHHDVLVSLQKGRKTNANYILQYRIYSNILYSQLHVRFVCVEDMYM